MSFEQCVPHNDIEEMTVERPWECEFCGLVHTHYPGVEHALRGLLGPSFVTYIDANPYCHCGWHEFVAKLDAGEIDVDEGSTAVAYIREAVEKLVLPEDVRLDIYGDGDA